MTDTDDLPAVFDESIVDDVAAEQDVEPGRLASLLAAHQAGVRDRPGVENLVYESRRQFDATVLETTPAVYYVATAPWVWEEFGASLDATEDETRALERVHERQVRDLLGDGAPSRGRSGRADLRGPRRPHTVCIRPTGGGPTAIPNYCFRFPKDVSDTMKI